MSDELPPTIDRLRTALRETAAQLDLSTPVPPVAVRPRPARRRSLLVAAAAVCGVIALAVGVVALRDDPERTTVRTGTSPNEQVEPSEMSVRDSDLEVYMDVDATRAEIGGVRSVLLGDPRVERFTFLNKRAAYAEFAQIFADQPNLVENVAPADLPTSFRIQLRDPTDRTLEAQLLFTPGVDDTTRSPGSFRTAAG